MLRFQGCDLHIHYRGISSKNVTCIHEQMGRRRRKEQNKNVTDGSEMMQKKEVTGVSEQRLTCENPLESARTCPTHEFPFKSFNLDEKKDIS